jgi:amino acid adenylation domain-containing protein
MTPADFLLQLRSLGVKLSLDGEQLRISAPKDALTPELREELKARKADLVRFLRQRAGGAAAKIEPAPRTGDLPLSFGQERLWLLQQLGEDFAAYNMPMALRLRGALDTAALGQAIQRLVDRHEALRTAFAAQGDRPVQVVAPNVEIALPVVDVSSHQDPRAEAARRAAESALASFDITQPPLCRFLLLKVAKDEHVLAMTMSHIVGDGWSYGVLLGELARLYEARTRGGAEPRTQSIHPLPIQYADYAVWQRQSYAWESARLLGYWKPKLANLATLDLPTDRPRPGVQTFRGAKATFVLPPALTEALRAVGQKAGCTFFMTALAAFKLLLARYARQEDIAVGTAIANRDRVETQPLIGMFMNTLVMRTDLSGDPSFRTCLARVREVALGAYQHQEMPFEQLVVELRPERDPSRNPLFQVAFLLDDPAPRPALGKLEVSEVELAHVTAKFDLTLAMQETANGLAGVLEYNVDLFDAATIARMAEHFQALVAGVVAEPDRSIWTLPILTAAERALILDPNRARTDYPLDRCVHELVAACAAATPSALAVAGGGRQLTYRDLDRRSNQIAHWLRARGVGKDVLVGVLLERTPEMVCALLGVMKAGGAYVPLDPANPEERQAAMIEDARMPVLLTQESLFRSVPAAARASAVCLEKVSAELDALSTAAPKSAGDVESLAYVIFTSGSTGRPKGVEIPHRALLNLIFWHRATYRVTAADRATQIAGLAFDASVWELWPYLTAGASIHLPDEETRLDPKRLLAWLEAMRISIAFAPTPLAEGMLEERCPEGLALRALLTGGDKLHRPPPAGLPFELVNHYGPTESTVVATAAPVPPRAGAERAPSIGRAITNVEVYLLDPHGQPVPIGVPGEMFVGGASLARGYHRRPELTAERFVAHPFTPGARLYRTGDLARWQPDGNLEFLGRIDHQVKVRGFRIELGEIEQVLLRHPAVAECAVVAQENKRTKERQLAAYAVLQQGASASPTELREHLRAHLPDYMLPVAVVGLPEMPLTANGKVDRKALSEGDAERVARREDFVAPSNPTEVAVAEIWKEVLHVDAVGRNDNFFDLGGHSALVVQLRRKLQSEFGKELSIAEVFQFPTVAAMAAHIGGELGDARYDDVRQRMERQAGVRGAGGRGSGALAVIGMSGRYPKARTLDEFWDNLRNGVECVTFFTKEDSAADGVDPRLLASPDYIGARAILDDIETWDPAFFGVNPREAETWDPQQRLFLECSYEALEGAGYDPLHTPVPVGVFAGCQPNSYAEYNLRGRNIAGVDEAMVDPRFIATRVSYKLNLRGPGVFLYSACSTSLVAVVQACQSLLDHRCDMALAGGTAAGVPRRTGHVFVKGEIYSPDGHTRAFDARAQGTVSGEGVGVVLLKRLEDALADGDHVHAVIRAAAINNDGSNKVGFTAPSVEGQAEVIAMALAQAGVDPATIGMVEGHGTATPLGDPIEVAALTRAYRAFTDKVGYCALGSVKTNIAHLDTGAGIAGFIKTVLSIERGLIPASLNFEQPNPEIDFAHSPFFVPTQAMPWRMAPRRAGVSSFGFGGTNAHCVLEEAPPAPAPAPSRRDHLLVVSAKTKNALEEASARLGKYLAEHPDVDFADIAFTMQVSRGGLPHRRAIVCTDHASALEALNGGAPRRVLTGRQETTDPPVVFMFPGQGAQYANMGRELYEHEPVFRAEIDRCAEILRPHLGRDLRELLYPEPAAAEAASAELGQTRVTQPAVFAVEYALAKLWMSWGVRPSAMIGHSVGELVAACLAGVFTLPAALRLVAARGEMMQSLPAGDMLGVPLPEEEVEPLLDGELSLAAVNAPSSCVVSGPTTSVRALEERLAAQGLVCRPLHTSHAFHSAMMDPIVAPFTALVREAAPAPAQIPCVSTVTGRWIEPADWASPEYWARNLRSAVRFSDGVHELLGDKTRVLLEVGPGQTLSTLVRQHADGSARAVIASMRHPKETQADLPFLVTALGRLWLAGVAIDWKAFHGNQPRRRVPLPTYPFQRRRYWVDPAPQAHAPAEAPAATASVAAPAPPAGKRTDVAEWFWVPSWRRVPAPTASPAGSAGTWLLFLDGAGLGERLASRLAGERVIRVRAGAAFRALGDDAFELRPGARADYVALLQALRSAQALPAHIVHLFGVAGPDSAPLALASVRDRLDQGFYSLLFLAQALAEVCPTAEVQIDVVADSLFDVTGGEAVHPDRAAMVGPVRVVPQEHANYRCRLIDVQLGSNGSDLAVEQLLAECRSPADEPVVAYRGPHRWLSGYEQARLAPAAPPLREGGVYLITGGLGGIGLVLAEYLAEHARAKLVLIGRSGLPPKSKWDQWLGQHGESDRVSRRIRKVRALEERGAQVLVASADVADVDQMRDVVARARVRFGALHGVIHSAGLSTGGMAALRSVDAAAEVLAPKIEGTLVLQHLLADQPLDFFVVCSSVSSILGGLGGTDYCGANAFLDAIAQSSDLGAGTPFIAVNWDAWSEVGMAAETEVPAELRKEREQDLQNGILSAEGCDAFARLLAMKPRQIAVFTRDLAGMMRAPRGLEAPPAAGAPVVAAAAAASAPASAETAGSSLHPRPDLPQDYVAPRTTVEHQIAGVAQQLLGIDKVGIHDNFFDLGFDSLLAHRMIGRLQEPLGVGLPLRVILEMPSVAEVAKFVESVASSTEVTNPQ